jgi:hypothetical protein
MRECALSVKLKVKFVERDVFFNPVQESPSLEVRRSAFEECLHLSVLSEQLLWSKAG